MMSSSTSSSPQTMSQSCAPPSMYAPMRRCPVRKFKRTISNSSNESQIRTKKIIMQSKSKSVGDVMSQSPQQRMLNDKPNYFDMNRRRVVSVSCFEINECGFS